MRSCEVPELLAHVISMRVDPEKGEEVVTRTAGGGGVTSLNQDMLPEMQQIKSILFERGIPSGPQK